MEGSSQEVTLPRGDSAAIGQRGQRFGVWAESVHQRGTDEDRVDRMLETFERQISLEAVDLAAEGVALDGQVHQTDAAVWLAADNFPRQQDHACTGAPHWQARPGSRSDRLFQTVCHQELAHGSALATWDDQSVEPNQIFW